MTCINTAFKNELKATTSQGWLQSFTTGRRKRGKGIWCVCPTSSSSHSGFTPSALFEIEWLLWMYPHYRQKKICNIHDAMARKFRPNYLWQEYLSLQEAGVGTEFLSSKGSASTVCFLVQCDKQMWFLLLFDFVFAFLISSDSVSLF